MSNPVRVVAREAFFIKVSDIGRKAVDAIVAHNTHMFFEEKACGDCEWNEDRLASETKLSEACPNCAAFKGGVALAKEVVVGKNKYISVPAGERKSLKKILKDKELVFKSKRVMTKFKRPIKFTGTLKDFQGEALDAIDEKKYGVIKAPPRSGKTVLSVGSICRIGHKTIILAAQREWLDGFYETFCGSPTQKPLTNAKKSQVGYARTLEEFKKYDVCLVTYQTFNSPKGKKLLKKIRDLFTVCFIDEVSMGAATNFAVCVSRLNVKYRIGLDGTPNRKDGKYLIVESLLGPIIYEAKVKRLRPTVRLVRTQYTKSYKGRVLWPTMISSLEKDPKRLMLIAKWALKDVKDGHMILIPMAQVIPIKALCMAINRLAGKRVAHPFHGGLKKDKRKQIIQDARNYKVRIIVGSSKLISRGTNIPRASAIYDVSMSANQENAEQRVSRVLTPWDDKPPPLLRMFLDDMNVRRRCMATEWWGTVNPKFRPIIADKDLTILKGYLAQKESAAMADWNL